MASRHDDPLAKEEVVSAYRRLASREREREQSNHSRILVAVIHMDLDKDT